MFLLGQVVGKYQILSNLGSGGFGTVFLARDSWIDKKVAIKVPHRQTGDADDLLQEPRLLAALDHPNIGVVFDIDPEFDNTEEWWLSIPEERRPRKDQPFYHLFAENAETEYIAYVSEQNLLPDESGDPVRHPQVAELFERDEGGGYRLHATLLN